LVAEADYQELIEPWLRTPPGLSGRRYAALALARLCGARTWPQAGLALGWVDGRGSAVAEYVCEFVVDPAGFWQAITALAGRLRERGPLISTAAGNRCPRWSVSTPRCGSGIRRAWRQVDACRVQGGGGLVMDHADLW
jgi:hypothetical protein